MYGASGDAHLRSEVFPERAATSASCWRRCGVVAVSTFIVTCAPSFFLPEVREFIAKVVY